MSLRKIGNRVNVGKGFHYEQGSNKLAELVIVVTAIFRLGIESQSTAEEA